MKLPTPDPAWIGAIATVIGVIVAIVGVIATLLLPFGPIMAAVVIAVIVVLSGAVIAWVFLRGRPGSTEETPPQPTPPPPLPPGALPASGHNLPERNPLFTGREGLLTALGEALRANGSAQLQGLGGMGKTQTALEYAWRRVEDYPFLGWLRAEDPEILAESFAGLAPLLGLATGDTPERATVIARVRDELASREGGLLVFDNVEARATLAPYLIPQWRGHTLITTRHLALGVARPLAPEPFTVPEAEALLAGHLDPGHPAALAELVAELGGLPLALEQARAYLAETGGKVGHYLTLFRGHRAALLEHRAENSRAGVTVATTWRLAFERVAAKQPAAATFLNLCAFLAPEAIPHGLFTEGAERLTQRNRNKKFIVRFIDHLRGKGLPAKLTAVVTNPVRFDRLIAALRAHALLTADGEHLSFHRLVRAVLYDGIPAPERGKWLERTIRLLDAAFPFDLHDLQTWPPSGQLLPHVISAWGEAKERQFTSAELGRLLNQAGEYLWVRGEYAQIRPLLEAALAIHQAIFGEQHPHTAASLNNLALLLKTQGQYAEARPLYEEALAIHRAALGDRHPDTAASLNNLAELLRTQGQYAEARPLYEEALAIRQAVLGEQHPHTATSLNNLALLLKAQGEPAEARPLFEQALAIRRAVLRDEHPDTAISLNNLGLLVWEQGDRPAALAYLTRALEIRETALPAEHPAILGSLWNLGNVCRESGRLTEAQGYFARARDIQARHPEYRAVSREKIEEAIKECEVQRRRGKV
uniref:Tfp pilus assembly protein PilF n=1 Tax=Candidatus Kentrum sp. FM TaxID=2126340 RepID=A0A450TAC3_9GAMM|nr:MAG: Tfp pilus assembly protein PilF [Candidatus Kentron sp. FM]VFJ63630.1 MAG: Tfp pilus assembly protein PilF [Candidatus Kentron sp. FM]VFK14742.1 MAG: Tfp pilus assembly protein PilF [Candidatus Kentron sp. FM]